jgi:peptidoglycan/xylan/chitin deacetylase (PgdA/CDA1 family)
MKRTLKIISSILIIFSLTLSGCGWGKDKKNDGKTESNPKHQTEDTTAKDYETGNGNDNSNDNTDIDTQDKLNIDNGKLDNELNKDQGKGQEINQNEVQEIDLNKVKPNELGKIMVVMFHNFVETFSPTKYDKGEYTMTFKAFEELLQVLYDKGYRLISFKDFLDNNISVPAGCTPMVFTFDDATSGQFNLIEEDGILKVNEKSAVGIMLEFNKKHPDFGAKGMFFVNLGSNIFNGSGNTAERLKYLIDLGFEVGNHTYSHINLKETKSIDIIQKEIGNNQKVMYELVPGYKMFAFSLPYGAPSGNLIEYVKKGEYESIEYENLGIVEVGWNPSPSAISRHFNSESINRVRAPGINPEKFDLNWWIENISREEEYISDGNENKITVPEEKIDSIDMEKLGDKELVTY